MTHTTHKSLLRAEDRVARSIVKRRDGVRTISSWELIKLFVSPINVILFLIVLVILFWSLSIFIAQLPTGNAFDSRYAIWVPFMPLFLGYYFWDLFYRRIHRWELAIRSGRLATATLTHVARSTVGPWMIVRGNVDVQLPNGLRVSQIRIWEQTQQEKSWLHSLKTADEIVVLLHPRKPKVLVAIGPAPLK